MKGSGLWNLLLWWEDDDQLEKEIKAMRMNDADNRHVNCDGIMEVNWEEVGIWYWNAVLESLEGRPEEALVIQYGQYPLERYFFRSFEGELQEWRKMPIKVCKRLIECSDRALRYLDDDGETVLHKICEKVATERHMNNHFFLDDEDLENNLIVNLYRAHPKALTTQSKTGKLPIHYYSCMFHERHSLNNNNHSMWEYLISQCPTSFVHCKDDEGYTPLDIACNDIFGYSVDKERLQWRWEYLTKLLCMAATAQRKIDLASTEDYNICHGCDDDYLLPEMHSCVYLQCPFYIIQKLSNLYSHQLIFPEKKLFHHCTPLSIACKYNNNRNNYNWGEKCKKDCIACLLTPQSAKIPCKDGGELFSIMPLHLTLQNGNTQYHVDAISSFIKASPLSLSIRHPINHFYPFLLAAVSTTTTINANDGNDNTYRNDNKCSVQQLESIYHLLREVPWIIEHYTA